MRRFYVAAVAAVMAAACSGQGNAQNDTVDEAAPAAPAEVRLYVLECGTIFVSDLNAFSDVDAYTGQTKQLTDTCFLIQHGEDYLLWDAGLPDALNALPDGQTSGVFTVKVPRTLASQIEELGLTAGDIDFLGISHSHFDHVGNANAFASATLILQSAEWDALFGDNPIFDPEPLSEWADGENVVKAAGDHDVFGDGSVMTLSTPGHTPGHQALLVRLANTGPVILSGDWAHFTENREGRGVPDFNTNRADTLASFDRLEGLIANLDARLILQHEPADIAGLPQAPEYLD